MTEGKIIPFPTKPALFNHEIKARLEEGLRPLTEKPSEVINTTEQILCTYLVAALRGWVNRLATRAGESLARKVAG